MMRPQIVKSPPTRESILSAEGAGNPSGGEDRVGSLVAVRRSGCDPSAAAQRCCSRADVMVEGFTVAERPQRRKASQRAERGIRQCRPALGISASHADDPVGCE